MSICASFFVSRRLEKLACRMGYAKTPKPAMKQGSVLVIQSPELDELAI